MNPLISEFSYGYAVTDELIHGLDTPVTAAPVFPSLYQEGRAGGGYDVMLSRPGIPLFIQFKLSHCLTRSNATESDVLSLPYYRMHLRPSRRSNQHSMLLALEAATNDVYYCAPAFHRDYELNDAYLSQKVCKRSIWLSPSCIGPLPDDGPHSAAFQGADATYFYLCSQPRRIDAACAFEAFTKRIFTRLKNVDRDITTADRFATLAELLRETAARRQLLIPAIPDYGRFRHLRPIEQAAVLAKVLCNTQLYVAALNELA